MYEGSGKRLCVGIVLHRPGILGFAYIFSTETNQSSNCFFATSSLSRRPIFQIFSSSPPASKNWYVKIRSPKVKIEGGSIEGPGREG